MEKQKIDVIEKLIELAKEDYEKALCLLEIIVENPGLVNVGSLLYAQAEEGAGRDITRSLALSLPTETFRGMLFEFVNSKDENIASLASELLFMQPKEYFDSKTLKSKAEKEDNTFAISVLWRLLLTHFSAEVDLKSLCMLQELPNGDIAKLMAKNEAKRSNIKGLERLNILLPLLENYKLRDFAIELLVEKSELKSIGWKSLCLIQKSDNEYYRLKAWNSAKTARGGEIDPEELRKFIFSYTPGDDARPIILAINLYLWYFPKAVCIENLLSFIDWVNDERFSNLVKKILLENFKADLPIERLIEFACSSSNDVADSASLEILKRPVSDSDYYLFRKSFEDTLLSKKKIASKKLILDYQDRLSFKDLVEQYQFNKNDKELCRLILSLMKVKDFDSSNYSMLFDTYLMTKENPLKDTLAEILLTNFHFLISLSSLISFQNSKSFEVRRLSHEAILRYPVREVGINLDYFMDLVSMEGEAGVYARKFFFSLGEKLPEFNFSDIQKHEDSHSLAVRTFAKELIFRNFPTEDSLRVVNKIIAEL